MILALTIFAGAVVVLGEVARHSLDTARIARDLTYAQLICESEMAQVVSGMVPPDPVSETPVDALTDPNQMGWVYSLDPEPTNFPGLIAVTVTVTQSTPNPIHPVTCTLVRWMQDPSVNLGSTSSGNSGSGNTNSSN